MNRRPDQLTDRFPRLLILEVGANHERVGRFWELLLVHRLRWRTEMRIAEAPPFKSRCSRSFLALLNFSAGRQRPEAVGRTALQSPL